MHFAVAALLPASILFAQIAPAPAVANFSAAAPLPGSWSYRALPGATEAQFIDTGGNMRLVIRCTRTARQVTISKISAAPAATLVVWTSSAQRALPSTFDAASMRVSAVVGASDRLLDAIAFSRGRIAIAMPGSPPLVVTPGPEAARVFEDCRN